MYLITAFTTNVLNVLKFQTFPINSHFKHAKFTPKGEGGQHFISSFSDVPYAYTTGHWMKKVKGVPASQSQLFPSH